MGADDSPNRPIRLVVLALLLGGVFLLLVVLAVVRFL